MTSLYFTNHCANCRGGVEFPPYGVGEQISCPHCLSPLTLEFPSEQGSEPTKLIDIYLQSSTFPSKRAELFLLTQFHTFPQDPNELRGVEHWRAALSSEPSTVISLFVEQGMLRDGSDDVLTLLQTKSGDELRRLAEIRGLGKSGTKETLAKRLFKKDPEGMRELFRGKTYLVCTRKAQLVVDEFLESERSIKTQCEQATFSALMEGRLKDACLAVATFEASRVFPRGLGIDWHRYNCDRDMSILQNIFSAQLARHSRFDQSTMLRLRVAAAMIHLCGTNNPSPWLAGDLDENQPDLVVEVGMLFSCALGRVRLQEMKRIGIARVEVLSSGWPDICATCRRQGGKTYPIDAAPVLPHESCTCKVGCKCILVASK